MSDEQWQQLINLAVRWEKRSKDSLEEGLRIRNTVKEETRAEARCSARAEVWDGCAIQLRSLLTALRAKC